VLSKALALHLASLGHCRYGETGPLDAPAGWVVDMPNEPHLALCIYPRAGFPGVDLSGYVRPELQVIVRTPQGSGHQAGYDRAEAIRRDLDRTCRITWAPGTEHEQYVLTCDANEPEPLYLGLDPVGRPRWSVSVQTELTKEAA
jgi:hypothetical protein